MQAHAVLLDAGHLVVHLMLMGDVVAAQAVVVGVQEGVVPVCVLAVPGTVLGEPVLRCRHGIEPRPRLHADIVLGGVVVPGRIGRKRVVGSVGQLAGQLGDDADAHALPRLHHAVALVGQHPGAIVGLLVQGLAHLELDDAVVDGVLRSRRRKERRRYSRGGQRVVHLGLAGTLVGIVGTHHESRHRQWVVAREG